MTLITLLTDFGTADSYVGEMKGVLATLAPGVQMVDISHDVPPGDIGSAAYVLGRTWHRFPEGTVHLVVVDPGVGTARDALAFRARGHFFVGPDNGVFTPVFRSVDIEAVAIPVPAEAAPTFHGRDLFAPVAAALARGDILPTLGSRFTVAPKRVSGALARHDGKSVVGEVTYVDRFGNLITNLTPELVPDYATLEVEGLNLGPLRSTFGDVPAGGLVAYVGSGGTVEVAVRNGSAARRLGLGVGGRVRAWLG
jgi:S-adenosylmethionine hydrolase